MKRKTISMLIAGAIVTQTISPTLITYANELNKTNNSINLSENNLEVNIPDANLKAALNKAIDSNRADNQAITQAELQGLSGELNLTSKGISNLEGIEDTYNIDSINLSENSITDIRSLYPLLLKKYNILSFSGPANKNFLNVKNQNIVLPEVTSSGSLIIKNPLIDERGRALEPTNISNGGVYNKDDNTIKFDNINKDTEVTFTFDDNIIFNSRYGNYNMGKFSGTVTQKVKYAAEVNIPDANLKAALNKAIDSNRADDQAITQSELESLTGIVDFNDHDIEKLEGIQYCTNLTSLRLAHNKIIDISPLANLTNLTELTLDGNKISDVSALSGLTNLTELYLGWGPYGNEITDIGPLSNLINLTKLDLTNNHISDLSSLSKLTNLKNLWVNKQTITGPEVTSVGPNVTVINMIKGIDSNPIAIANGDGYTYDSENNSVIFTGISEDCDKSYGFNQNVTIGQTAIEFSGSVTQKVKYNKNEFTSTFNIDRNNDAHMKIGTLDLKYDSTANKLTLTSGDNFVFPDSKLNINLEIYFEDGKVLTRTLTPEYPSANVYLKNLSRIYKLKITGTDRFNNIVKETVKIQYD